MGRGTRAKSVGCHDEVRGAESLTWLQHIPLTGEAIGVVNALLSCTFPKDFHNQCLVLAFCGPVKSPHRYYSARFQDEETEAGQGNGLPRMQSGLFVKFFARCLMPSVLFFPSSRQAP